MADDRIQTGTDASTDLTEGFPPLTSAVEDNRIPNIRTNEPSANEVFIAWEKLRVLYNIILIPCVFVAIFANPTQADFFFLLFVCNVFFCTGIIAEGYHCWLGINRNVARWAIFVVWVFITVSWLVVVSSRWVV